MQLHLLFFLVFAVLVLLIPVVNAALHTCSGGVLDLLGQNLGAATFDATASNCVITVRNCVGRLTFAAVTKMVLVVHNFTCEPGSGSCIVFSTVDSSRINISDVACNSGTSTELTDLSCIVHNGAVTGGQATTISISSVRGTNAVSLVRFSAAIVSAHSISVTNVTALYDIVYAGTSTMIPIIFAGKVTSSRVAGSSLQVSGNSVGGSVTVAGGASAVAKFYAIQLFSIDGFETIDCSDNKFQAGSKFESSAPTSADDFDVYLLHVVDGSTIKGTDFFIRRNEMGSITMVATAPAVGFIRLVSFGASMEVRALVIEDNSLRNFTARGIIQNFFPLRFKAAVRAESILVSGFDMRDVSATLSHPQQGMMWVVYFNSDAVLTFVGTAARSLVVENVQVSGEYNYIGTSDVNRGFSLLRFAGVVKSFNILSVICCSADLRLTTDGTAVHVRASLVHFVSDASDLQRIVFFNNSMTGNYTSRGSSAGVVARLFTFVGTVTNIASDLTIAECFFNSTIVAADPEYFAFTGVVRFDGLVHNVGTLNITNLDCGVLVETGHKIDSDCVFFGAAVNATPTVHVDGVSRRFIGAAGTRTIVLFSGVLLVRTLTVRRVVCHFNVSYRLNDVVAFYAVYLGKGITASGNPGSRITVSDISVDGIVFASNTVIIYGVRFKDDLMQNRQTIDGGFAIIQCSNNSMKLDLSNEVNRSAGDRNVFLISFDGSVIGAAASETIIIISDNTMAALNVAIALPPPPVWPTAPGKVRVVEFGSVSSVKEIRIHGNVIRGVKASGRVQSVDTVVFNGVINNVQLLTVSECSIRGSIQSNTTPTELSIARFRSRQMNSVGQLSVRGCSVDFTHASSVGDNVTASILRSDGSVAVSGATFSNNLLRGTFATSAFPASSLSRVCTSQAWIVSPASFTVSSGVVINENFRSDVQMEGGRETLLADSAASSLNVSCGPRTTTTAKTTVASTTTTTSTTRRPRANQTRTHTVSDLPRIEQRRAQHLIPAASRVAMVALSVFASPAGATSMRALTAVSSMLDCGAVADASDEVDAAEKARFDAEAAAIAENENSSITGNTSSGSNKPRRTAAPFVSAEQSGNALEPLEFDNNLLLLSIGPGDLSTYRGSVISAIVLTAAVLAAGYLAALLRAVFGNFTLKHGIEKVHVPGVMAFSSAIVMEPCAYAATVLLLHPKGDLVFAIVGVVVALSPFVLYVYVGYTFTKYETLLPEPTDSDEEDDGGDHDAPPEQKQKTKKGEGKRAKNNDKNKNNSSNDKNDKNKKQKKGQNNTQQQQQRKRRGESETARGRREKKSRSLFEHAVYWIEFFCDPVQAYSKDSHRAQIWAGFVDSWRLPYFGAFDLAVAVVLSVAAGVSDAFCRARFCCVVASIVSATFSVVYLAFFIVVRPALVRYDRYNLPLTYTILVLFGVFAIVLSSNVGGDSSSLLAGIEVVTQVLYYVALVGMAVGAVASMLPVVLWLVRKCSSNSSSSTTSIVRTGDDGTNEDAGFVARLLAKREQRDLKRQGVADPAAHVEGRRQEKQQQQEQQQERDRHGADRCVDGSGGSFEIPLIVSTDRNKKKKSEQPARHSALPAASTAGEEGAKLFDNKPSVSVELLDARSIVLLQMRKAARRPGENYGRQLSAADVVAIMAEAAQKSVALAEAQDVAERKERQLREQELEKQRREKQHVEKRQLESERVERKADARALPVYHPSEMSEAMWERLFVPAKKKP